MVILNLAIVVILNNLVKHSTLMKHLTRSALIIAALLLIWFAANTVFSSAFSYFQGRVAEAVIKKTETDNVSIRFDYVATAQKILRDKNLSMTGVGFIRDSYPQMERVGAFAADSTITLLFLHTGWIGVTLIYLIWIFFTYKAFILYRKTNDWLVQYIASYGLSTILVSTLMGTDIRGGILSMMLFALLNIIRFNMWNKPKELTQ
jgi:hypothetical protein